MACSTAAIVLHTQVDTAGLHQKMDSALRCSVAAGVIAGNAVDSASIPGAGEVHIRKGIKHGMHQFHLQIQHVCATAIAPTGADLIVSHIGASLALMTVQLCNGVKQPHSIHIQPYLMVSQGQVMAVGVFVGGEAFIKHRCRPQISLADIGAVRVDTGHHIDVDGVQKICVFCLVQLVNHIQRTFSGSVLVAVHLGLVADVGQTVCFQSSSNLFQGSATGQIGLSKEDDGNVKAVGGRLADGENVHIVVFIVKTLDKGFQLRLCSHLMGRLGGIGEHGGHQFHLSMPLFGQIIFSLVDKLVHLAVVVGMIPLALGGIGLLLHHHFFHIAGIAFLFGNIEPLVNGVAAGALGIIAVVAGDARKIVVCITVDGLGEIGLDLIRSVPIVILIEDHSHIGLSLYDQTLEIVLIQIHPGTVHIYNAGFCRELDVRTSGSGDERLVRQHLTGDGAVDCAVDSSSGQTAVFRKIQSTSTGNGSSGHCAVQAQGLPCCHIDLRSGKAGGCAASAGAKNQLAAGAVTGESVDLLVGAIHFHGGCALDSTVGGSGLGDLGIVAQGHIEITGDLAIGMGRPQVDSRNRTVLDGHIQIAGDDTVVAGGDIGEISTVNDHIHITGDTDTVNTVHVVPGAGLHSQGGAGGNSSTKSGCSGDVQLSRGVTDHIDIGINGQVMAFTAEDHHAGVIEGQSNILEGSICLHTHIGRGNDTLAT